VHEHLPLGRNVAVPEAHAPEILQGIERTPARAGLGIPVDPLPFHGEDVWNAYELSWLSPRGTPRVAIGVLRVPCSTPRVVESKSLKLYLGSLNQERLGGPAELQALVAREVGRVVGGPVQFAVDTELDRPLAPAARRCDAEPPVRLDALDLEIADDAYRLAPQLLQAAAAAAPRGEHRRETLVTHAFRSCCPVTGQPDWATLRIAYEGSAIDRESLQRYLISFRRHRDFHEACVERIWWDVQRAWRPEQLTVEGRFTRRGGIDINPLRSSAPAPAAGCRTLRQ
jgi:7-cyano-7-deazaguanine reductase